MLKRFFSAQPFASALALGATGVALAQSGGAAFETASPSPAFVYSVADYHYDEFTALADADIERAKDRIRALEEVASAAPAIDKKRLDHRLVAAKSNLLTSETKLAELKDSPVARRKALERSVTRAIRHLLQSIEKVI